MYACMHASAPLPSPMAQQVPVPPQRPQSNLQPAPGLHAAMFQPGNRCQRICAAFLSCASGFVRCVFVPSEDSEPSQHSVPLCSRLFSPWSRPLRHPATLSPGQEPECSLPAMGPDVLKVNALICMGGHRLLTVQVF